jgi:hypothetical protein
MLLLAVLSQGKILPDVLVVRSLSVFVVMVTRYPPDYAVQHPKRQTSLSPSESQITHGNGSSGSINVRQC